MSTSGTDDTRSATTARHARIEALATLPVFFKLGAKRAVLAGGSEPALWKAELLAAAGADVDVFAETLAEGFAELAAHPPAGRVTLNPRRWQSADLSGAAVAVGAITNDDEAAAFASAARAAGVPVNVIDRPAFCDFQFGAIVNRSPLVVAISTDGAAPVLGQAIRSLIEGLLPEGLRRWVAAARDWRSRGDGLGVGVAGKRRFWDRFTDLALREADRAPTDADLERLLADAPPAQPGGGAHPVAIIDVGAAGVETLTLAALRALRGADLILFDEAVPPAALAFARREARRDPVPPAGSGATATAAAIAERIVAAATEGRRVVRLRMMDRPNAGDATDAIDTLADLLRAAGKAVVVIPAGRSA
jgi:uroporphyrin-III C-methyltransferase/precorrin-2 dehydrogenase/sirohydrochlorin ferrochelatase